MNYSLSNHDIKKALNNNVNIITYNDLSYYNNIKKAFNHKKFLVILFENKKNFGHWCCLFFHNNNTLEFFDSYGLMPDDELKFTSNVFRKNNNMLLPHLTYLLLKSPYNIEYNNYKFQSYNNNTNTCGRWVIVRLLYNDININDFYKIFGNIKNSDKFITKITNLFL